MPYINDLAKALINLKKVTQISVSIGSGVQKGNLSIWLQGKRKLSSEAEENILSVLGVIDGQLRTDMVHCWTVGLDLTELNFVLDALCPKPELQHLLSTSLTTRVTHYPLTAIKSRAGLKILIKQKPTASDSRNSIVKDSTLSKETIPNSKWLIDKQPRAVEENVYDSWQKGVVSMTDFNEYVTAEDIAYTWMDVLDRTEDIGISPAEIMNAIDSIIKNKKK